MHAGLWRRRRSRCISPRARRSWRPGEQRSQLWKASALSRRCSAGDGFRIIHSALGHIPGGRPRQVAVVTPRHRAVLTAGDPGQQLCPVLRHFDTSIHSAFHMCMCRRQRLQHPGIEHFEAKRNSCWPICSAAQHHVQGEQLRHFCERLVRLDLLIAAS